jgi:hypothetical protein
MNREVSAEVIADFASHIEGILISAYDDESSLDLAAKPMSVR